MTHQTFHFVRIPDVELFLQLGWVATNALEGTQHGQWSVLCRWLCNCPIIQPKTR
jgi:hypothetical protein